MGNFTQEGVVLSITNNKGGVGKTTISTNLSHILASAGYKVLHCDLDNQGSSTQILRPVDAFGNDITDDQIISLGVSDLFIEDVNTSNYIFHTKFENLDIIPNAQDLVDILMNGSFDEKFAKLNSKNNDIAFLKNLNKIRNIYDYIIIDTQPKVDRIYRITLLASDYVLCPADADNSNIIPMVTVSSLINTFNVDYGLNIRFLGCFLNRINEKDEQYINFRNLISTAEQITFIDCPIRESKTVKKSSNRGMLWLENYLINRKKFPFLQMSNPLKDLFQLMLETGIINIADLDTIDVSIKQQLSK